MWQELRAELHPRGLEIVTVGMDTVGAEACRRFIEAAKPEHPSLIDVGHLIAERFGVINIPNGVWIDEEGVVVRPAEPAYPRTLEVREVREDTPGYVREVRREAAKIVTQADEYIAALRDWVANGRDSKYALSPDEVVARSGVRDRASSDAAAHFALAEHLWRDGKTDAAVTHFQAAHRLLPENFSYKRQAWSLAAMGRGLGAGERHMQIALEGHEDEWPYESDWLTEIKAMGAENYYPRLDLDS